MDSAVIILLGGRATHRKKKSTFMAIRNTPDTAPRQSVAIMLVEFADAHWKNMNSENIKIMYVHFFMVLLMRG